MIAEEREMLIMQIKHVTGMSVELLRSLRDNEIERLYRERVVNRGENKK